MPSQLRALCAALAALCAIPAQADVLFESGDFAASPYRVAVSRWDGFAVSQRFTLAENAYLTGVDLALFTWGSSSPTSLAWNITPQLPPANAATKSGANTALVTNTSIVANCGAAPIPCRGFQTHFDLSDLALDAGAYYLTITNVMGTSPSDSFGWSGDASLYNNGYMTDGTGQWAWFDTTFKILGDPQRKAAAVPEPASGAIAALGLGALLITRRRKSGAKRASKAS